MDQKAELRPDTSIKDTYQGEFDTFSGIFEPGEKRIIGQMGFTAGAHSVLLLALKRMMASECRSIKDVADILNGLLDESEACAPNVELYRPHNQN